MVLMSTSVMTFSSLACLWSFQPASLTLSINTCRFGEGNKYWLWNVLFTPKWNKSNVSSFLDSSSSLKKKLLSWKNRVIKFVTLFIYYLKVSDVTINHFQISNDIYGIHNVIRFDINLIEKILKSMYNLDWSIYCICIILRGGIYGEKKPEHEGSPEGVALTKFRGRRVQALFNRISQLESSYKHYQLKKL